MKAGYLTDAQVSTLGWRALVEKLGPATALRFIMQHEPGNGDYVEWRHEHLASLTVEDWVRLVKQRRRRAPRTRSRKKR